MSALFKPGTYKVISAVRIRKEPRVVEWLDEKKQVKTNQIGSMPFGRIVKVIDVVTDSANQSWGQVTDADATGTAGWICLKSINRTLVELIAEEQPGNGILARLEKLEAWAKTRGYQI